MSTPKESIIQQRHPSAEDKEQNLRLLMRQIPSVLVAFSGGVDSTYVALIATQELGKKAVCVMGLSASVAQSQRHDAESIAKEFGFNFVTLQTEELADPNYLANPTNRCYFCKSELYGKLTPYAQENGIAVVFDGSNMDDTSDFRPGRQAASENNVRSPLIEVGLSKAELRELSKKHGLPTWDKPSSPCLSSRIAYGVPVSIERLSKVERGEEFLRSLGLKEFRVRNHGELARLEVAPTEMEKVLSKDVTDLVAEKFRELGFRYVTLDLHGYRTGSLNEVLEKN